jgi:hypothetical protein
MLFQRNTALSKGYIEHIIDVCVFTGYCILKQLIPQFGFKVVFLGASTLKFGTPYTQDLK